MIILFESLFMNVPLEHRHNPSRWADLLDKVLPLLDDVGVMWTLGGGTALALRISHRVSDDIDIFVPGAPLKRFSPVVNPLAKAVSPTFQWPGHCLKFELDFGEIDILSVPLQTENAFSVETFRNRAINMETCEEIIVKKVRFRSASFTFRDVFDLVCVNRSGIDVAKLLANETPDALDRLETALTFVKPSPIRATPAFKNIVPHALRECQDIITCAKSKIF